eukprot:522799-Pleurochrysis_carterae.AAC.1
MDSAKKKLVEWQVKEKAALVSAGPRSSRACPEIVAGLNSVKLPVFDQANRAAYWRTKRGIEGRAVNRFRRSLAHQD